MRRSPSHTVRPVKIAAHLMDRAGVEALVLSAPEGFHYASRLMSAVEVNFTPHESEHCP